MLLNSTELTMLQSKTFEEMIETSIEKTFDITRDHMATVVCDINIYLMVFGLVTNICSLCVFLNVKMRQRKFNWYLLINALFEIIFCKILFIDYIFTKYKNKIFLHDINSIFNVIIDFTTHSSDSCSTLLAILLSLDRLYAIKWPLNIKNFVTQLHAKKLILMSLLISILMNAISYTACKLKNSNHTLIIYCSLISPQLFSSIPLIIILVLNVILIKEVIIHYNKSNKNKINFVFKKYSDANSFTLQDSGRDFFPLNGKLQKSDYGKLTHYIFIIVSDIWSLLTIVPYYVLNTFLSLIQLKIQGWENVEMKTIILSQIASSILFNSNHCFKFFIYISFYKEFRRVLKSFFTKLCIRNDRSNKSFTRMVQNETRNSAF